jgi:hypothetical protein
MPLDIAVQLSYDLSNRDIVVRPLAYTVTPTNKGIISGVLSIATSMTAIPIDGLTAAGMAVITNLDTTNYLELGYDSSGFVAVMRIPKGASVVVNFVGLMATPQAKANTAACLLSYTIVDAA